MKKQFIGCFFLRTIAVQMTICSQAAWATTTRMPLQTESCFKWDNLQNISHDKQQWGPPNCKKQPCRLKHHFCVCHAFSIDWTWMQSIQCQHLDWLTNRVVTESLTLDGASKSHEHCMTTSERRRKKKKEDTRHPQDEWQQQAQQIRLPLNWTIFTRAMSCENQQQQKCFKQTSKETMDMTDGTKGRQWESGPQQNSGRHKFHKQRNLSRAEQGSQRVTTQNEAQGWRKTQDDCPCLEWLETTQI